MGKWRRMGRCPFVRHWLQLRSARVVIRKRLHQGENSSTRLFPLWAREPGSRQRKEAESKRAWKSASSRRRTPLRFRESRLGLLTTHWGHEPKGPTEFSPAFGVRAICRRCWRFDSVSMLAHSKCSATENVFPRGITLGYLRLRSWRGAVTSTSSGKFDEVGSGFSAVDHEPEGMHFRIDRRQVDAGMRIQQQDTGCAEPFAGCGRRSGG